MSTTITLEDVWQLFRETDRLLKEQGQETDRKIQELAEVGRETGLTLKQTQLALQETERVLKEQSQETDRRFEETDRQLRETYGMVRELRQQIGGLGNKFGSFTEGLALPSIEKILRQCFNAEIIAPRVRIGRNGVSAEYDVVAWTNSTNTAVAVEIKSHLREDGIEQLLKNLAQFAYWFPGHETKAALWHGRRRGYTRYPVATSLSARSLRSAHRGRQL